ncbi:DUF4058 family protein [Anaerolineales bacterium HSG6]|nr:DUF4058 family protein [Anaerolineales bacterium HSG6]MDM8529868.1 DUF4058 family protein [Anaerolineales bacterium HSG25]
MPSPFPGMDPYFEDSEIWSGFHHDLATEIKAQLNPPIGPKYYADVETYTSTGPVQIMLPREEIYPDVGVFKRPDTYGAVAESAVLAPSAPIERAILSTRVKLRTVKIYVTKTSQLVTAIEILSPYNKQGQGLSKYREKRGKLLRSPVHLVELDLLRRGTRPGPELNEPPLECDYLLLVNRGGEDRVSEFSFNRISQIWPVSLNEPFPMLPIPLLEPDPDVTIDLRAAIDSIYQRSGYEWRIDYRKPVPAPQLRPPMADWLAENLPEVASSKLA